MLFVLTGKVQTGKTRWLQRTVECLEDRGVVACGVLAPGIWVECEPNVFDKYGIDNILLPQKERVPFGRRKDFPSSEPFSSPEESIARTIAQRAAERAAEHAAGTADGVSGHAEPCGVAVKHYRTKGEEIKMAWDFPAECLDRVNEHLRGIAQGAIGGGFLIIDEIGRMELQREEGLVGALELLDRGPTPEFPHALVVVRETLLPLAKDRFEPVWGSFVEIHPDADGFAALCAACGVEA